MILNHKQNSEPLPPENNAAQKKEQIGTPMLFPVFFCLISGLLLILLEDLTMKITGYMLAAGLIGWGVWQIVHYFRSEPIVRIVEAKLATGLILLVSGSLLAFSPESLKDLLPCIWGLVLLFGGFLKIQYAFDRKNLGAEKWWILLILAAFSITIGVVSLLNPAFLGNKKELIIGILLTVEAVLDFTVFLLLKRKIRKQNAPRPTVNIPVSSPASAEPPAPEESFPESEA